MDIFTIYIALFFIVFLIMPVIYFTWRFLLWFSLEYCGCRILSRERDRDHEQHAGRRTSNWGLFYDRQGNIFSISDEASTNAGANRYPDFFYLEPSSDEAARIRAQLEKDDKDLPSYEDVIRMTSPPATPMTPPVPAVALPANVTAAPSPSTLGNTMSMGSSTTILASSSNNLTAVSIPPDMAIPPPSYSETPPSYEASSSSVSVSTAAASTSRGAAVTIPITNSASNTSV